MLDCRSVLSSGTTQKPLRCRIGAPITAAPGPGPSHRSPPAPGGWPGPHGYRMGSFACRSEAASMNEQYSQFIIVAGFGVICFGFGYLIAFVVVRNQWRDEM